MMQYRGFFVWFKINVHSDAGWMYTVFQRGYAILKCSWRPVVKKKILISQPKHMLWVLKEPSQRDSSFEYPKHMLQLMGKKIFKILRLKMF